MMKSLHTIRVFTKISTKRFFRDRLAIFFTIVFPLIFLFVFGGIFGKQSDLSFKVGLVSQSQTEFAKEYQNQLKQNKIFEIDTTVNSLESSKQKMSRGELDATIVLADDFGTKRGAETYPSGQIKVYYSPNNEQAAQTLESVLQVQLKQINKQFVNTDVPFTVTTERLNEKTLSRFDYTFAGLLGFAIVGLGIFGPINVFPELKKQGVLRRLHTTPLKTSEYFVSNALSQAVIGLLTMAVMFAVAIAVFDLKVVGNILALVVFLVLSIISILGIGLAIGGWAKNERQAAPLGNIVVFPMLFLSGTFFPRFLMPEWLQNISNYLPLTPVIDGIRLIATEGRSLVEVSSQVLIILIWTIVVYAVAFRVFRWE
jgi:ABC-2 type transport system permease protein